MANIVTEKPSGGLREPTVLTIRTPLTSQSICSMREYLRIQAVAHRAGVGPLITTKQTSLKNSHGKAEPLTNNQCIIN